MRHHQVRWAACPSRSSKTSIFNWWQMTRCGLLGELLPTLHKVMLNFCESLRGHPGRDLPTFRERKVQFKILWDGIDFILQRNKNRALQYDDCQLGDLLSPTRQVLPYVQFDDPFDKKRIS